MYVISLLLRMKNNGKIVIKILRIYNKILGFGCDSLF